MQRWYSEFHKMKPTNLSQLIGRMNSGKSQSKLNLMTLDSPRPGPKAMASDSSSGERNTRTFECGA